MTPNRVEIAALSPAKVRQSNSHIERKPDSSQAQKGIDANFRAKEKDVLEMIKRLEAVITKVAGNAQTR
jgi:hypothetical protein